MKNRKKSLLFGTNLPFSSFLSHLLCNYFFFSLSSFFFRKAHCNFEVHNSPPISCLFLFSSLSPLIFFSLILICTHNFPPFLLSKSSFWRREAQHERITHLSLDFNEAFPLDLQISRQGLHELICNIRAAFASTFTLKTLCVLQSSF